MNESIVSNSSVQSLGRSPDASKIYNQYVSTSGYIDNLIHQMDIKYQNSTGDQRAQYLKERSELNSLKGTGNGNLFTLYQAAYGNSSETIEEFDKTCAQIKQKADDIANGGGSDPKSQISNDTDQAKIIEQKLQSQVDQNAKEISSLSDQLEKLETTIKSLEKLINDLPATDPRKATDGQKLATAKDLFSKLEGKLTQATKDQTALSSDLDKIKGELAQLEKLNQLTTPTAQDAQKADDLLAQLQKDQGSFNTDQSTLIKDLPSVRDIDLLNSELDAIAADFDPKKAIAKDLSAAQEIISELENQIKQNQSQLDKITGTLQSDQALIASLETKINQLKDSDPRKKADGEKLTQAKAKYTKLQSELAAAKDDQTKLNSALSSANAQLASLQTLASLPNPTEQDKQKADGILKTITADKSSFENNEANFTRDLPKEANLSNLKASLDSIAQDLNPTPPPPIKGDGQTGYFDFGTFGAYIEKFVDYSKTPPVFDSAKFEVYLTKVMKQMQGAGINHINMSMAQLNTLEMLVSGKFTAPPKGEGWADSFTYTMWHMQQEGITFPKDASGAEGNILSYISEAAKNANMKLGLALGGAAAQGAQWDPSSLGATPEAQAKAIATMMEKYNIQTLDVDYESNQLVPGLPALFKDLHTDLEGTGRKITLTVPADVPPKSGGIAGFFYGPDGKSDFTSMFDGLNVMAYANGGPDQPYYLNPGLMNGLIQAIGGDPKLLNIGFQDAVDYTKTDPTHNFFHDWNGVKFDPTIKPGSTPGSAAAQLYQQLIAAMVKDGYLKEGQTLGNTFWWPDENVGSDSKRYDPNNGNPNFWLPSNDEQDFYNYLHGNQPTPPKSDYSYEEYTQDWGSTIVEPPKGMSADIAFGVINDDGTFDRNYPVPVANEQNNTLAIGGWNNSQKSTQWGPTGLYKIMHSTNPQDRQNLINNIVKQASSNGYKSVVMDYECYDKDQMTTPKGREVYTKFMQDLDTALKGKNISLQMAISPSAENETYYNLSELVKTTDITFQPMTYDYSMGQKEIVGNASVAQSKAYLETLEKTIPQDRMKIGLPGYGTQFTPPANLTEQQFLNSLSSGTPITATNVPTQVDNDTILNNVGGSWDHPANGWKSAENKQGDTFYYHVQNGTVDKVISAFPPKSVQNFADMVKAAFPKVQGFFEWQAFGDTKQNALAELKQDLSKQALGQHFQAQLA